MLQGSRDTIEIHEMLLLLYLLIAMGPFVSVVITFAVGVLCYFVYNYWINRNKLAWIPTIPGHPLVGNILDFKKSTGA